MGNYNISNGITMEYQHKNTSVSMVNYYIVFCPKYRRKLLVNKIKTQLEEIIRDVAVENGWEIIAKEVMPDHVHLFIEGKPLQTPNYIIGQIKGYTFHQLREEFADLRLKLPTLWTRSYFVSTHGHISDALIKKYIDEQKGM